MPNLDHLLLVHHVNLSDLAVYRIRKHPLMAREPALTNLLELTTLRPPATFVLSQVERTGPLTRAPAFARAPGAQTVFASLFIMCFFSSGSNRPLIEAG
jgi:hypothetical protein